MRIVPGAHIAVSAQAVALRRMHPEDRPKVIETAETAHSTGEISRRISESFFQTVRPDTCMV